MDIQQLIHVKVEHIHSAHIQALCVRFIANVWLRSLHFFGCAIAEFSIIVHTRTIHTTTPSINSLCVFSLCLLSSFSGENRASVGVGISDARDEIPITLGINRAPHVHRIAPRYSAHTDRSFDFTQIGATIFYRPSRFLFVFSPSHHRHFYCVFICVSSVDPNGTHCSLIVQRSQ